MKALTLTTILLLIFTTHLSVAAQSLEQKDVNFKVNAEVLLKGGIHYSFQVLSPEGITKLLPELREFDSIGILKDKNASIMFNKFAFVIKKPVGFFDQRTIDDEKFISHLLAPANVTKIRTNEFVVKESNPTPYQYEMRGAFDSDDITTVPNSKSVKSITATKKLDVMMQTASSVIYREMTKFTLVNKGAITIEGYLPLKDERTLVIGFQMVSLQDYKANSSKLRSQTVKQFEKERTQVNSFKAE